MDCAINVGAFVALYHDTDHFVSNNQHHKDLLLRLLVGFIFASLASTSLWLVRYSGHQHNQSSRWSTGFF